jgi:protease IV
MDQSPRPDEPTQPPIRAEFVPQPIPIPPARRESHFLCRLFLVLAILCLLASIAFNIALLGVVGLLGLGAASEDSRVEEKFFALNREGSQKIAIFSIEGMILSGEGFFKQQIDHAMKDWDNGHGPLKAIVVRVNSPGGTISGSDYMFHYLRQLAIDTKMPIVVSMGGAATSGGYYVSMCVGDRPDTIFAEPMTATGSIGVLFPLYNFAELAEKWGIKDNTISTHPLKTAGSPLRKLTPEERKIFQGFVDDALVRFKEVIHEGRPTFRKDPAALDKLATGQVFMANQARDNGLIDKIGFIEDAINRAINLAGLSKKNVKVVKYKARTPLSELLFAQQNARPQIDLATLLESTTPRAYYLCTWLPALASSEK